MGTNISLLDKTGSKQRSSGGGGRGLEFPQSEAQPPLSHQIK